MNSKAKINKLSRGATNTTKSHQRGVVEDSPMLSLEGRRVLVTGGNGLIGRRVVDLLDKRGVKEIIVYDISNRNETSDWNIEDSQASPSCIPTVVHGDVRDSQALMEACRNVDVVLHLAAKIDISPATDPVIYDVNVGGTKNVIDACIANNVKVLVVTSSIEAGGLGPKVKENEPYPPPRDESSTPREGHISTHYAESKRQTERLVLAAHGTKTPNGNRLATVCIRPGLVVDAGPGNMALGNALLRASQLGGLLHLYQTPVALSWVHARNAALVHICAAERACNNHVGGRVFHAVDFDANLTDMYQEIFSDIPDITIAFLPLSLAMASTWFLDRCFRLLNSLTMAACHYRLKPNPWCPGYTAASITFHDFCFANVAARKHLGYTSLEHNGGIRLKTRAETIDDAKAFSNKFYSKMKQENAMYALVRWFVSIFALAKLWLSIAFFGS